MRAKILPMNWIILSAYFGTAISYLEWDRWCARLPMEPGFLILAVMSTVLNYALSVGALVALRNIANYIAVRQKEDGRRDRSKSVIIVVGLVFLLGCGKYMLSARLANPKISEAAVLFER